MGGGGSKVSQTCDLPFKLAREMETVVFCDKDFPLLTRTHLSQSLDGVEGTRAASNDDNALALAGESRRRRRSRHPTVLLDLLNICRDVDITALDVDLGECRVVFKGTAIQRKGGDQI